MSEEIRTKKTQTVFLVTDEGDTRFDVPSEIADHIMEFNQSLQKYERHLRVLETALECISHAADDGSMVQAIADEARRWRPN